MMILKRKFLSDLIFGLSVLMMLGGCAISGADFNARARAEAQAVAPAISPQALPDIPALDALACRDPGVTAGQPALNQLAENRLALGECRRRHGRVVNFYKDLQAGHTARELSAILERPNEGAK
ncbi:MAG: hypothetical protein U5K75_02425 [Ahrensia sp.]|nr:hypothetical protein [Ahrensia sp.]